MKIENLKEFIKSTKKSKSTIVRFYKKNEDLFLKTEIKNGKRYYPKEHVRYFDSEILHDENKLLRLENQSMKNLIDCLVDKDSLQYRLWQMDWSFFFTVAYKTDRNKKSCFRQMHSMYEMLISKYGDETGMKMFFTTEAFSNRTGYHNHFVLHVENKKLHQQIVEEIQSYFSYDRVDCGVYDKYKAGLFYASKEGLVNEDWDIIGNNLGDDTN
ncbi:hypothetical protein [Flavobacterium taihuense]|uniref:Uncharacterized protein n=1 Tax=Flavobacterium taihuense TaxID=2857508 RepID=A0ABS6XV90_9FLAO|nr:hypothetical protein [Flavobacterium taihuense]MBW4359794.1 hypothetical protein [Flavobacterium taihuense]